MRLGVPVEWHEGRVLTLAELERRRSYRDPDATAVGRAIARDGLLDAAIIGAAARTEHSGMCQPYMQRGTRV